MFKALLAGLAFTFGTVSIPVPASTPAPASFSLVLESTQFGWAASCDSGCRWRHLALSCDGACGVVTIDANGVERYPARNLEPAAFGFRVERSANGVRAKGQTGTLWETLGWTCRLNPCRARVDWRGVSAIDIARLAPDER